MSKGKKFEQSIGGKEAKSSTASNAAYDPALASLFASSSGPVKVPEKQPSTSTIYAKPVKRIVTPKNDDDTSSSESEDEVTEQQAPPRKRRKVGQDEDLETTYLNKLVREEEKEQKQKQTEKPNGVAGLQDDDETTSDEDETSDAEGESDSATGEAFGENGETLPVHESLQQPLAASDKNKRTVFLSNVSTKAIVSKSARKTLLAHLKTALDAKLSEKIESIRFRSTAFASGVGPKRAAYAKKELMEETSRNTNAYVVLSSEAAARKVALKLNGTIVLDRHVHVDSLANPTKTDHRRCVFVGNLPFVDEETTEQDIDDETGQKRKRPRGREPADAEEGLWRTFGKCGKVESVRVVRDKATRVGKGFAYVQFEDGNGVEKALELEGKRFPPLLPRTLRVTRAKRMQKKELRAKGTARGTRGQGGKGRPGEKTGKKGKLDGVIFEGYRASSGANSVKLKAKGRSKSGVKPTGRGSRRGAAFKASGGKKKRDD